MDHKRKEREIPDGYALCPLCVGFGCKICDCGLLKKVCRQKTDKGKEGNKPKKLPKKL